MVFVDTHAHLYDEQFHQDREQVILNALQAGVTKIIVPAVDRASFGDLIRLAQAYPSICFPLIGLHPTSVHSDYKSEMDWLANQLEQNSQKFVAIGEIGLDFYWETRYKKEQENAFLFQLELARAYKLPVVIHSRNAFEEVYSILLRAQLPIKGVFHCFSGNFEQAQKLVDCGFKIGIGGVVTFKNSNLGEVVKQLKLKDILLETDSPYLTPVPYRGKRNQSSNIPLIAQKVAELHQVDIETVARQTTQTALQLFDRIVNI